MRMNRKSSWGYLRARRLVQRARFTKLSCNRPNHQDSRNSTSILARSKRSKFLLGNGCPLSVRWKGNKKRSLTIVSIIGGERARKMTVHRNIDFSPVSISAFVMEIGLGEGGNTATRGKMDHHFLKTKISKNCEIGNHLRIDDLQFVLPAFLCSFEDDLSLPNPGAKWNTVLYR